MNAALKCTLLVLGVAFAAQAAAQITLYEREDFAGRSLSTHEAIDNFERTGFNDRASSVVVLRERWEVCEDALFAGRCVVLRPGRYRSLAAMGLNDRVSSVRTLDSGVRVDSRGYAPAPAAVYAFGRRDNERLYEANVTSVRAVVGTPQQRCWVDREQVVPDQGGVNVPAAIVGAVLGGVLGHQVGGGHGKDFATAGGAVAGAVIGANIGRNAAGQHVYTDDVERCSSAPSQAQPEYWDVTYEFRGQEHRMQTVAPPGRTVTVNRQGAPRT